MSERPSAAQRIMRAGLGTDKISTVGKRSSQFDSHILPVVEYVGTVTLDEWIDLAMSFLTMLAHPSTASPAMRGLCIMAGLVEAKPGENADQVTWGWLAENGFKGETTKLPIQDAFNAILKVGTNYNVLEAVSAAEAKGEAGKGDAVPAQGYPVRTFKMGKETRGAEGGEKEENKDLVAKELKKNEGSVMRADPTSLDQGVLTLLHNLEDKLATGSVPKEEIQMILLAFTLQLAQTGVKPHAKVKELIDKRFKDVLMKAFKCQSIPDIVLKSRTPEVVAGVVGPGTECLKKLLTIGVVMRETGSSLAKIWQVCLMMRSMFSGMSIINMSLSASNAVGKTLVEMFCAAACGPLLEGSLKVISWAQLYLIHGADRAEVDGEEGDPLKGAAYLRPFAPYAKAMDESVFADITNQDRSCACITKLMSAVLDGVNGTYTASQLKGTNISDQDERMIGLIADEIVNKASIAQNVEEDASEAVKRAKRKMQEGKTSMVLENISRKIEGLAKADVQSQSDSEEEEVEQRDEQRSDWQNEQRRIAAEVEREAEERQRAMAASRAHRPEEAQKLPFRYLNPYGPPRV